MFKRYKWILHKKRYTKVNKHMKKCLASLVIREIQIKTAMTKGNKLIRKATIKKTDNIKCQRGYRAARTASLLVVTISETC